MDTIEFGFLFAIGAALAIWVLRALGGAAQSVTKVVLDKTFDSLEKNLAREDELKRGGLRFDSVKREWVSKDGKAYGLGDTALMRLRAENIAEAAHPTSEESAQSKPPPRTTLDGPPTTLYDVRRTRRR
jgi:hypothetical protein